MKNRNFNIFFESILQKKPFDFICQSQEQTPPESPLPSPCKLIQQCNAAVTNAGDDIERAAEPNEESDSDSDNEKKPVFQ